MVIPTWAKQLVCLIGVGALTMLSNHWDIQDQVKTELEWVNDLKPKDEEEA